MRKWFTNRVLPGVEDVLASPLCRQSEFIREDFPTFDLPMNANSGYFAFGLSFSFWLLPAKMDLVIFMLKMFLYQMANVQFFCTLCKNLRENG